MADTAREFFETLESRADPARTAGIDNSYLFDVEGAGRWLVSVENGTVTVTEGGGEADATIAASEETFMKIVRGEQNPATAYITGKVKVAGDTGAVMKLQKLF